MKAEQIKVGGVYRHYKGREYKVIAIAADTAAPKLITKSEDVSDSEKRVIYKAVGDAKSSYDEIIWDRPYGEFAGSLLVDGNEVNRFTLQS